MARFNQGINGAFQGKVGTVVGATWKGIPYMRALPRKRTSKATANEEANRGKFATAHHWLRPLLSFVRVGFNGASLTVEGFNAAKSHLLKNAFELKDGQFVIDPARVQLSSGILPLSDDIKVQLTASDTLEFSWNTADKDGCSPHDQVMLLAYDPETGTAEMQVGGLFRNAGRGSLKIAQKAATYHVYIAFIANDRSCQSDSLYLGAINNNYV